MLRQKLAPAVRASGSLPIVSLPIFRGTPRRDGERVVAESRLEVIVD